MIKAIVIDDEPLARAIVLEYLQDYKDIEVVQECSDGFDGLKAIMHHKPELLFLDIQMPKINGFEMLELVEAPPSVIFTTAFDEYALKAFETHAVDYLLKPFGKERFDKAIQNWLEQYQKAKPAENTREILESAGKQPEEHSRVVVKSGNAIKIIPVGDILYIEAYDDYVKIHIKDGGYHLKKKTMAYYEQTLADSGFVRVHRSYLIALQQITRIEQPDRESHIALLKDGTKIPLSRGGYGKLKGVLGV